MIGKESKFERVKQFKYLWTITTTKGQENVEIDHPILKGNKAVGSLSAMLQERNVYRAVKIRIYETVIHPAVLYACETSTIILEWFGKIDSKFQNEKPKKVEKANKYRNKDHVCKVYNKKSTIVIKVKAQRSR